MLAHALMACQAINSGLQTTDSDGSSASDHAIVLYPGPVPALRILIMHNKLSFAMLTMLMARGLAHVPGHTWAIASHACSCEALFDPGLVHEGCKRVFAVE